MPSTSPTPRRGVIRSTSQSQSSTSQALSSLFSESRAAGDSSEAVESTASTSYGTPRPGRVTIRERTTSNELKSGKASPVLNEQIIRAAAAQPNTEIRAGLIQKPFYMPTALLCANSLFFSDKVSKATDASPMESTFFYPDLDEYAMALFVRWLYSLPGGTSSDPVESARSPTDPLVPGTTSANAPPGATWARSLIGETLRGPTDFQTLNHYLSLYVLGVRFRIEPLRNNVIDLVRSYYRKENMTAPSFRLDYIYSATEEPCQMRRFLVRSAAYRAVADAESVRLDNKDNTTEGEPRRKGLSDSMKGVISGGGKLALDFIEACLAAGAEQAAPGVSVKDPRRGPDCEWHDHAVTAKCEEVGKAEPWERT